MPNTALPLALQTHCRRYHLLTMTLITLLACIFFLWPFATLSYDRRFVASSPALRAIGPTPGVHLLYQNNLNWTDDIHHHSWLLLPSSYPDHQHAERACGAFAESLLSTPEAKAKANDLLPLLRYHTHIRDLTHQQAIRLSDGFVRVEQGHLGFSKESPAHRGAPVLCTQSSRSSTAQQSNATDENSVFVTNTATGNRYKGYRNLKSFRFLGIPYSNSPGRWEYAKVNPARGKTFDANTFGAPCIITGDPLSAEDCLFLNIRTPYLPSSEQATTPKLRPVVVFIHGGAFTSGTGGDPLGEGGNLASRGDVVMVTFNYRLSNLGFLVIPGTDVKGNYGFADQTVALHWVRDNIKTFGGDPDRIVIWGQSAGAASVQAMLGSPVTRGHFAGAIISSNPGGYGYGGTYSKYLSPDQAYEAASKEQIEVKGCKRKTRTEEVQCLKGLEAHQLVDATFASLDQDRQARFLVVDGHYIVEDQLQVTDPNKVSSVPTIWGHTAEDGAPFLNFSNSGTTREQAIAAVLTGLQTENGQSVSPEVEARPDLFALDTTWRQPSNASFNAFALSSQLATDVAFACYDQATVYSGLKHQSLPKAWYYVFDRTYQYYFNIPPGDIVTPPPTAAHPFGDPKQRYLRAHGGDLLYQFSSFAEFALPFRDEDDLRFTQLIVDYWTSFIHRLDPEPDRKILEARGYWNTLKSVKSGGPWKAIRKGDAEGRESVRDLNWPGRQGKFRRTEQCEVEGLPIASYRG